MASLWGDEFTVPSTKEQAKKVIKKAEGKTVQQLLKSKTVELEEKLKIINENVQKVLHVYEKDTLLIRDKQTLADYISAAIKNGIIAIDTETNNSLDPLTCKLMGPCIYTPGEKNVYIPINHVNRKTGYLLPDQLTEEDIKEQFDRLNEANVKVIAHNSSFDYQVLKCTTGYEMNTYWDTLTGSMILDENERSHRLKDQYRTKVDPSVEKYSIDHLFNDVEYKYVDPEIFALYAATDPYITYKLYEYQKEQFEKPGNEKIYHVFRDIDMPVNVIAAEMELRGCCIDEDYAERLSKKYHRLLDQAEKSIYDEIDKLKDQVDEWRLTPEANYKPPKKKGDGLGKSKSEKLSWPVAISSPTQLSILLYDVLKVPPVDKDNPRGTGADILEKIDLPVCKTIVKQRGLAKLIDTFIDKMLEIRSPRDNRVHGHFNVNGTACVTGDTPVVTKKGVCRIDELILQDGIESPVPEDLEILNEYNEWEHPECSYVYRDVKTIKIQTNQGFELEGTPNHPIRVIPYNCRKDKNLYRKKRCGTFWKSVVWKNLGDIEVGDYVLVDGNIQPNNQPYIPTGFSQEDTNVTHKKSGKMPEFFDEDFAEFLGMFHADGALRYCDGSWRLFLYNEHPEVVERWTYLCKKLFDLDVSRWDNDLSKVGGYGAAAHKLDQLHRYITTGKRNKKIPKEIFNSRDSVFYAYLRGCSLDSGYDGREVFMLSLIDPEDCKLVQQRLLKQGILSSVRLKNGTTVSSKVCVAYQFLPRFLSLTGPLWRKTPVKDIAHDSGKFCYNETLGLFAVSVLSKTESENDVYDFTMPKTHSFLSGGLVSHNTGRFSSSEPNLQNIPSHSKDIRPMFCASPGCMLVGADFSW